MACRSPRGVFRLFYVLTLLTLSASLVAGCAAPTGLSLSNNSAGETEGQSPGAGPDRLPGTEGGGAQTPAEGEPTETEPLPVRAPRVCPSGAGVGAAAGWGGEVQGGALLVSPTGDVPAGGAGPDEPAGEAVPGDPAGGGIPDVPADDAAGGAAPDSPDGTQPDAAPSVAAPVEGTDAQPASLEQALQAYLTKLNGTYGLHLIDLTTGETTSVNADQVFVAASTFKVPMAMYVLDLVGKGMTSLDEPLAYSPEDWEAGTGVIQSDLVEGDCYIVSELLDLMLTESDNIATNMLLRRFGEANAFAYMERLGGTVTHLETGRRATTPREMAQYLAQAYRTAAAGDPLYRTLLERLMHTAFADRIAAGVPEGIQVAHKIGTLPGMVHDVGVVLLPDYPFVLAIFSTGVDEADAAGKLAEITSLVYDYQKARVQ